MDSSLAAANKKARKRTYHELDTPYASIVWPSISARDENDILDVLVSLLRPLGQYRERHVIPSKGRRARNIHKGKDREDPERLNPGTELKRPVPEIAQYVDVGLTAVSRNLQSMSRTSNSESCEEANMHPERYAVIFIVRAGQSTAYNCHIPQMVGVAASSCPGGSNMRLVGFMSPCSERLSQCLGIPRVSCVGLRSGAPGADVLVGMVRDAVPEACVSWFDGEMGNFKPTKINTVDTVVGERRKGEQRG